MLKISVHADRNMQRMGAALGGLLPYFRLFLILVGLQVAVPVAYGYTYNQCAAQRNSGNLNCTAGDVSITQITPVPDSYLPTCVGGGLITLDLDVSVKFASPSRYDIGVFLSNDGKTPRLVPASGGAASCSVAALPKTSPFLDLDGDSCGDGTNTINGNTGVGTFRMYGATLPCTTDGSGNTTLYAPYVVTWAVGGDSLVGRCTGPNDISATNNAKCNASQVDFAGVSIVVMPEITKTANRTTTYSGDTITYTVVIANKTGSSIPANSVIFTDPVADDLSVIANGVSCTGTNCPAAGSVTVAAMQGSGILLPAMPNNSSVTFRVVARVTGNPTSVTNTAYIKVSGQTNSVSSTVPVIPYSVRLEHDGAGTGCIAEPVVVRACANSDCSLSYQGDVSATLSTTQGSWASNHVTVSGGSVTANLTVTTSSSRTATIGAGSFSIPGIGSFTPPGGGRCYNSANGATSCSIDFDPCPATCGSGNVSPCSDGVINTYYPGIKAEAEHDSVTVGASVGCTDLKANDLILVMQMQDADVEWGNDSTYGRVNSIRAGQYEYAVVKSYDGSSGVITLSSNLKHTYTNAAADSGSGKRTFQVIRVPTYSSGALSSDLTARAWDGSVGGVLALDVSGALDLHGATVDVSGKGFRGGGGRQHWGSWASGSNDDYRTPTTISRNGSKGEGAAGTPRYILEGTAVQGAWAPEGYPNGANARGAPANGGGGGTDGNPGQNNQNTGGGGGGNAGAGGQGGWAWCDDKNSISNSSKCPTTGGIGGRSLSLAASRLTMGGGGGAGTTNDGTGSPGGGVASSGAAGGGIIMVRAGTMTGMATFNANGTDGNDSVGNDGSGGGGAGGVVLLHVGAGGIPAGVVVNARGGKGGNNSPRKSMTYDVGPHGPGGGGGGGYVITSSALGSGQCSVMGGAAGITAGTRAATNGGDFSGSYGATAGGNGSCVTSSALNSSFGSGPCKSTVAHYAVSNSGNGITCEAEPVTITAHDSNNGRVDAGGRSITVTALQDVPGGSASGTWVATDGSVCGTKCYDTSGNLKSSCANSPTYTPTGDNTGVASYVFGTGESAIQLCLKQNNPITETFSISDNIGAKNLETQKIAFSNTAFRFYADGAVDTLGNLIAGLGSEVAEDTYQRTPQVLTVRALKSLEVSPARCVPLLAGTTKTVQFAYQCIDPDTCQVTKGLEVNDTPVEGSGSVPTSWSNVSVAFDASGYGSIKLKYWDVGQIKLFAQAAVADAATKGTASILRGASNAFVVKPFGFSVIPCTGAVATCSTAPEDPGLAPATGSIFTQAGKAFKATIKAVAYGGATVTPSFGLGTGKDTEAVSLSHTLVSPTGTGAVTGSLSGTTSILREAFSSGVATVSNLVWDEVGVIRLKADTDVFEGIGVAAKGTSGNLGRFTPDHFDTVVTQGCATGAFTYSGQPFTVQVTAMNGVTPPARTRNYDGSATTDPNFAKKVILSEGSGATVGVLTNPDILASAFSQGQANTNAPVYTFNAVRTIPTPITLRAKDEDSITSAGATEGTANIRSGRLWLTNAYGNEYLALPVPIQAQYWLASGWQLNTDDSCTQLVRPTDTNSGLTNGLRATTSASMGGSTATPVALSGGSARFVLTAPRVSGVVDISSSVLLSNGTTATWLPPSTGRVRACFGSCGPRSSVIYIRERY